jgi:hypothetical protein
LRQEKKEYLAGLREEWEKSRKEAIEHKKNNEYWKFLVSTWWEQGCGRTCNIDYHSKLHFNFS